MAEGTTAKGQSDVPGKAPTAEPSGHQAERGKPRRRFAPQLEETSVKSSRKARMDSGQENGTKQSSSKPRRRFAPQLEETTVRSSRKSADPIPPPPTPSEVGTNNPDRPRSRFTPQLIETAQRSRRRGDSGTREPYQTDFSPGDAIHAPRHPRLNTRGASFSQEVAVGDAEEAPESRFSYANLSKSRRSSARKPTLECIYSGESDDSKVPSLSNSPSAKSEDPELHKHAWQIRESCDERFTGYLLAHAARLAEKQLKEQAMTAYLNETLHEPVDHFAGARDSDESSSDQGFGMLSPVHSSSNVGQHKGAPGWEPGEMRRHQEALDRQRQAHRKPQNGHAARQHEIHDEAYGAQIQHPAEIRQMRDAARPPLLGRSLVFPSCPSPKLTHIDAYQKPRCRRYEDDSTPSREPSGLWMGCSTSPVRTRKSSGASAGLWGGFCDAASQEAAAIPGRLLQSGLLTPATSTPTHELADPFSADALEPSLLSPFMVKINKPRNQLPATPPSSVTEISGIDAALALEAAIDAEFPDAFITQIYNYLSLGYPALARKFDAELAKISRMSLEEIRHDDGQCDAKGFVGAPERADSATEMNGGYGSSTNLQAVQSREDAPDACGRWRALRLYVREWGRQEGRMREHQLRPGMQIVRRGSWLA